MLDLPADGAVTTGGAPPEERADAERVWLGVGRLHRRLDLAIGLALAVAATAVLLATDQMGYARDEAFYFGHAETYQDWQIEVEAGGERRAAALERDALLRTWRANSEHPPLDKVLFGWSWRLFGRKLREVGAWRQGDAGAVIADVRGLGPAHGYAVGARVDVLAPQRVGESGAVDPRVFGHGEVIERSPLSATIRLDPDAPALELLRDRCLSAGTPAPDGVLHRTGCEVVERRVGLWLSESASMRAPGMLFGALLVAMVWWFARGVAGGTPLLARPFALVASVGYLVIPRAFFHAHLAVFDTTITMLLVAVTLAYHRSLASRAFVWWTALLWGVALLAKHNAFVLPVALIGHWAWDALAEGRIRVQLAADEPATRLARWLGHPAVIALAAGVSLVGVGSLVSPLAGAAAALVVLAGGPWRISLPPLPLAWFVMLPVGLTMLVLGWPLLWVDTAQHLLGWLEFHLHHEHYMQTYFGRILAYPPFPIDLPFTLTLLTWPPSLLLPFAVGATLMFVSGWRRVSGGALALRTVLPKLAPTRRGSDGRAGRDHGLGPAAHARSLDRLLIVTAIWPLALIAMPSTPVFGGTKHWMAAYPAMLLIAARGLQWAWVALARPWLASTRTSHRALAAATAWALVALALVPASIATADHHPHGTTYYNELIGGVPGAAKADLQRQFWGSQALDGLEIVNARAKRNARIWFHNTAWGSVRMYEREGQLRRDLHYAGGLDESDFGLFHQQKDHDDYEIDLFRSYGTVVPIAQVSLQGVPLLTVYERPTRPTPADPPRPPAADERRGTLRLRGR